MDLNGDAGWLLHKTHIHNIIIINTSFNAYIQTGLLAACAYTLNLATTLNTNGVEYGIK